MVGCRRRLRAAEIEVPETTEAARILRERPEIDEVEHFGHVLRVAARDGVDPEALAREALGAAGIEIRASRSTRVGVEDAFVSMVRAEQRAGLLGEAA